MAFLPVTYSIGGFQFSTVVRTSHKVENKNEAKNTHTFKPQTAINTANNKGRTDDDDAAGVPHMVKIEFLFLSTYFHGSGTLKHRDTPSFFSVSVSISARFWLEKIPPHGHTQLNEGVDRHHNFVSYWCYLSTTSSSYWQTTTLTQLDVCSKCHRMDWENGCLCRVHVKNGVQDGFILALPILHKAPVRVYMCVCRIYL